MEREKKDINIKQVKDVLFFVKKFYVLGSANTGETSAKEGQPKAQPAAEPVPEKSDAETQKEIQAIFRQITASVTFLPMLDGGRHTFNVLVFTDASSVVPLEWGDSEDKQVTGRSEKVQLRSFSTNSHRVDTFVTYKYALLSLSILYVYRSPIWSPTMLTLSAGYQTMMTRWGCKG
jgi:hypothetical protein